MNNRSFNLIGDGRAGGALRLALTESGWECAHIFGRGDDISAAAHDVDACIIATPDRAIDMVAEQIVPGDAVVIHLSGAVGLLALSGHRCGAVHPLISLADAESGARGLRSAYFAVAGDPLTIEIAELLSGRYFSIADNARPLYHAAAAVASNHFVALLGQVERIAEQIDVPFEVFMPLVEASLQNVIELGPKDALTGPAARGDHETIERHRSAIGECLPDDLPAYNALVERAIRLKEDR